MSELWPQIRGCYGPAVVRGRKNPLHFGLAARLKQARRQSPLTRLPLSKKAGISDSTIAAIENGEQLPNVGTIARLAVALGVSAAWLAYGIGEQSGDGIVSSTDGMAERLTATRLDRGHSKASLAEATKPDPTKPRATKPADALSPGAILGIERGGQAGVDTVGTLARVLRVSPAWLAFGVGPQVLPTRRKARTAQPYARG